MASIHKKRLGSGKIVWELTHGKGASRIRLKAGDNRFQAEATLTLFKRQLTAQGSAPTEVSLEKALAAYGEYLQVNRRKTTARRYLRVLKTLSAFLHDFHSGVQLLRDIRTLHLEDYKRKRFAGEIADTKTEEEIKRELTLRKELENRKTKTPEDNGRFGWLGRWPVHIKVSQRTINYELQCIQTFLQWAIKQNYLFSNPAPAVERFRLPKKTIPKFMTSEELTRFFTACNPDQRVVFSTMLLTGMRKGELKNLTWNDLNFQLGIIFIQAKEGWNPKTDERIIPISPVLNQILLKQYEDRMSDQWVFANQYGKRLSHLLDRLKGICRRAGIREATLHSLRHSFGAHLRMAGVSLADIADLMGHKDLATTQIYAKVEQQHLRSVINKLTPLVPVEVSPESVTRGTNPRNGNTKLLMKKGIGKDWARLAEREGFEPSAQVLARATA